MIALDFTSITVIAKAYISLAVVNKTGGSSASKVSSEGFMTSGAVHLHVPAVLVDVKSDGSIMNTKP